MYTFFFFILGAIFGSFACVVVGRLFHDQSGIVFGRSTSENGRKLKWNELIPIFSYVFLAGKDRLTQKAIPLHLLLAELGFGVSFALLWAFRGAFLLDFLPLLLIAFFWGLLFLYDALYGLVDRRISLPFILLLVLYALQSPNWAQIWLAGAIGGAWFLVQHLVSRKKWVGAGDIDLGIAFGLTIGLYGLWPHGFLAYLLATLFFFLFWLYNCLKSTKKDKKSLIKLPMAPFLALSALLFLIFENQLADWYFLVTMG